MYNCVNKGRLGNTEIMNCERNSFKSQHVLYRTLFWEDCWRTGLWKEDNFVKYIFYACFLSVITMSEPGICSCNEINLNNKSLWIKIDYLHLIHLSLTYLAASSSRKRDLPPRVVSCFFSMVAFTANLLFKRKKGQNSYFFLLLLSCNM